MDVAVLEHLDAAGLRAALPSFVSGFLRDPDAAARSRARVAALVSDWSEADLEGVLTTLTTIGREHRPYPADPRCRALARVWATDVVTDVAVHGIAHLQAAARGPVAVVGNHLSYYDTSATDVALVRAGHPDLADRLLAAAGPKVYAALFRRVAAASLNTLPVPQSTRLEHTAYLSPRELARRALASVRAAEAAVDRGAILLVYPEGSRTRTGRLRPFLKGVYRYLAADGLQVVPAAITGTDTIMGLADDGIRPGPVTLSFGPPIRVHDAGGPRAALARAHDAVAALLPPERRPLPGEPAVA